MKKTAVSLLLAFLAACAKQTPIPRTTPAVPPTEPQRSSRAMTPVGSLQRAITEPRIRVGLLSDQGEVTFPRTADGYYLVGDGGPSTLRRGFTATAPLSNATVRFAVQVSAVSDEGSANTLAERIRKETGLRTDVIFDPAAGLRRVLAGDLATSDEGTPLRAQLVERGYGRDMLVVRRPSDQAFEKEIRIVDDEGDRYTVRGESVLVMPISAQTITIDKQHYRTAARIHVNPRGRFNVINELNLEDYLFGVVPAEMGPRIYDEVEALKAQAVAARTYAIRNLGQFRSEGYDICPGPACQAYKGFSGEEELSTRAVRETAGLILTHGGKPIDALYTSTCGGETSDVSTMFPGRNEPYLRRARCVEMEMATLSGRADSGLLTEQQANARLFTALARIPEPGTSWAARDVEAAVAAAARLIGMPNVSAAAPASSRRGDVLRHLASIFGFPEKAAVVTLPEDRQYFFPETADRDGDAYLAAAFLTKFGVAPAQQLDRVDLSAPMPRDELYTLLGSWVREHAALQEANGKVLTLSGRAITLKAEGKTTTFTLPENIPLLRRFNDRFQEYKSLPIMIGDRASVYLSSQKIPIAIVIHANYDGASFDRTSSFANWTRSYRADELVTTINRRAPIKELQDIRPLSVDASQRVIDLEVTAENGRKFTLSGLPVRWSLNVPDNLFVYDKTKDSDGTDRYTFFGKGWGHGTGFCQVGSYGMAFRGWTFDRILKHFYTDVELVPMSR